MTRRCAIRTRAIGRSPSSPTFAGVDWATACDRFVRVKKRLVTIAALAVTAAARPPVGAHAQSDRLTTLPPSGVFAHLSKSALRDSARGRLATLDGHVRLTGLDSAVEVRRDRWGVPHIYARTAHDVFFAQGYVAAQDRLFQMEIWRRAGEGRLAEVLGPAYVTRDRLARLFKYRGDTA